MSDEQLHVFISYSRVDSVFVDRLDADLRARGYNVWVDRRRLEGGQLWEQEIDAAIARCELFLLTLSPSAVTSTAVRHEFEVSERFGKRLIPIVWQAQGLVIPTWLAAADTRQRQDFTNTSAYALNLKGLLYAIQDPTLSLDAPTDALYSQALRLRSTDPERAAIVLQHIVDREPDYFGGQALEDLTNLQLQLYQTRVATLRASAEEARKQGQYGVEAASLEALLALGSGNLTANAWAREHLPIAQQNRAMLGPYSVIQDRMADDPDNARQLLQKLWAQAPYFRDPANLAPTLGLTLPPTYAEDKAAAAEVDRQREAMAAERKRREEATAAERARFEQADAVLHADLSGKKLSDVRRTLQKQNYDLDNPAMLVAIEQCINSWDESTRKMQASPSVLRQLLTALEYGAALLYIGLAILLGVVVFTVTGGIHAGDNGVVGWGLSVPVMIALVIYAFTTNVRRTRRQKRLQGEALAARSQAEQYYKEWRHLAETVYQQRLDAINK